MFPIPLLDGNSYKIYCSLQRKTCKKYSHHIIVKRTWQIFPNGNQKYQM